MSVESREGDGRSRGDRSVRPHGVESGGLFGGGDGIEEAEEVFDAGHLQGVVDALIDTDEGEGASAVLAGDVGTDEGADSRAFFARG